MAQKIRIGNVEIAAIQDVPGGFTLSTIFPQVPREAWRPYIGEASPDEEQPSRVMTFLVRSRGKNILVDTGMGAWGFYRFGDGVLPEGLKELGVSPEQIDVVLPTHLHGDHVGWNTRPSANGPVPTFPNARYLFQQADWDHFTNSDFLNGESILPVQKTMITNCLLPLKDSGLMDLIGYEHPITDEVTLLHTPGHTPGHVTVVIQSAGKAALLVGDVAHHPAEFSEVEWSPTFDVDPALSARSRRAIIAQAQQMDALVGTAHFNAPGVTAFGQLLQIDGRTLWRGVDL
jgi:glyoxylase-like metal-dependent hydrolase (beta-lactamase superfamily II)